ncbi:MAG TPA: hypothetical protein VFQ95_00445 [Rhodanobacteraceae bacterium]|nr:hypothetical protein [Rhodanobacteraceae bacterium]
MIREQFVQLCRSGDIASVLAWAPHREAAPRSGFAWNAFAWVRGAAGEGLRVIDLPPARVRDLACARWWSSLDDLLRWVRKAGYRGHVVVYVGDAAPAGAERFFWHRDEFGSMRLPVQIGDQIERLTRVARMTGDAGEARFEAIARDALWNAIGEMERRLGTEPPSAPSRTEIGPRGAA